MSRPSIKPFLRWAGSKKKLIPVLKNYWNDNFTRYVEPFVGSGCLFFEIQPKRAVLGDLNAELIETYKVIRREPEELAALLSKLPLGRDSYNSIRNDSTDALDHLGLAARFIYLNRYCFNGLFRTNNNGGFNVPYGGDRSGKLPSLEHLKAISKSLKKCSMIATDFEKILDRTRKGDFVYMDPPFAVGNRRVFKQYGPQNFGLEDLQRLSTALVSMDNKGVSFVVSYAYCREALELFKPWHNKKVFVQRNIAGFTKSRRRAAELIVSNISIN